MAVALFVCRTPLQVFNAIEARERFHADDACHLFCVYRRQRDRELMAGMVDDRWAGVRFLPLTLRWRVLYSWFAPQLVTWEERLRACYVGFPKHLAAHLVNCLAPEAVVLFDDGNETLKVAEEIRDRRFRDTWRTRLYRLLGRRVSPCFCYHASLFTIFDLSAYGLPNRVIRNDYRCFKARLRGLPAGDTVWFVGTCVHPRDIPRREVFAGYLAEVAGFYAGKRVRYIPHRYEPLEGLREMLAEAGIEFYRPDTILEYAVANAGEMPAEVATFRSTAVDSLATIYGLPGRVFRIASEDVLPQHRDKYRLLYDDFAGRDMPMVSCGPHGG